MAPSASVLGIAQAVIGLGASLLWVAPQSFPSSDVGTEELRSRVFVGLAMMAFAAAVLCFRLGRRHLAVKPPLPTGEVTLMAGCLAMAAGASLGALGMNLGALFLLGVPLILVGHALLAVGLFRLPPGPKALGLGPIVVVLALVAWAPFLEDNADQPERYPPRFLRFLWPLVWAGFHVVAGFVQPRLVADPADERPSRD